MSVSSVNQSVYFSDIPARVPKTELGKDDFLKLMITQMQNQNPLEPMDNSAYIAQMAQLSTLEQMTNMTQSYDKMRAFSMIGKNVKAMVESETLGETSLVSGKVNKVVINGSEVLLEVGGSLFPLSKISEVSDDE